MSTQTLPTALSISPTSEQYKEAAKWLLWSLGGGLMPLWGTFLVLTVLGLGAPLVEYIRHGEFMLYAAAFLAPACYQLFRDLPSNFPGRSWLGFFTVSAMVVAALLFGAVIAVPRWAEANNQPIQLKAGWLAFMSILILLISVALAFWITVVDMARTAYDARAVDDQQVSSLGDEVRKLQGETTNG